MRTTIVCPKLVGANAQSATRYRRKSTSANYRTIKYRVWPMSDFGLPIQWRKLHDANSSSNQTQETFATTSLSEMRQTAPDSCQALQNLPFSRTENQMRASALHRVTIYWGAGAKQLRTAAADCAGRSRSVLDWLRQILRLSDLAIGEMNVEYGRLAMIVAGQWTGSSVGRARR